MPKKEAYEFAGNRTYQWCLGDKFKISITKKMKQCTYFASTRNKLFGSMLFTAKSTKVFCSNPFHAFRLLGCVANLA